MGIEYYAFAMFISGLLCLIAILCKVLFADVRRQRKLLDEKETKLLKLYQSVEDVIEEFNDQVSEAKEEIRRQHSQLAMREAAVRSAALYQRESEFFEKKDITSRDSAAGVVGATTAVAGFGEIGGVRTQDEPPARTTKSVKKDMGRKAASAATEGVTFQRMIDELADEPAVVGTMTNGVKNGRNEAILRLKEEGKTVSQIAQELGITQNEVKLVIGLNSH